LRLCLGEIELGELGELGELCGMGELGKLGKMQESCAYCSLHFEALHGVKIGCAPL